MAPESCNLNKDEPEILKPSSPSPSPPSPPATSAAAAAAAAALFLKPPAHDFPSQRSPERSEEAISAKPDAAAAAAAGGAPAAAKADEELRRRPVVRFSNRCSSCRKRVGLTGFRCRCGDLFCPQHRYSDLHDCSFDYKAAGREEISKNNPVIRAAKIIRI